MALRALADTFRLLVITPYVWICGIFSALSILAVYYAGTHFGVLYAIPLGLLCLFILPAFIAGSYGIILENHGSPRVYVKYVKYGYFRCLLPMLLILLISWVAVQALTYILLMIGIPMQTAVYFGFFIILPIIFFWYFADLCAMLGARGVFGSLKQSFRHVMAGSFSVTAFYLFNIAAFFAFDFIFSFILPFFIPEGLLADSGLLSMSETELMNMLSGMTSEELLNFMAGLITPEVISAFAYTLAICFLVAIPFFITFKVCYFKRLLSATMPKTAAQAGSAQAENSEPAADAASESTPAPAAAPQRSTNPRPANDPHAGEDGEYDSKGRWFKYT